MKRTPRYVKHPSEFVPMPTPDGIAFTCTHPGCSIPAMTGCRNCGVARCVLHGSEQHVFPCTRAEPRGEKEGT